MPDAEAIKAGQAYVEILADRRGLDAGLREAQGRLKSFAGEAAHIAVSPHGMMRMGGWAAVAYAGIRTMEKFGDELERINTLHETGKIKSGDYVGALADGFIKSIPIVGTLLTLFGKLERETLGIAAAERRVAREREENLRIAKQVAENVALAHARELAFLARRDAIRLAQADPRDRPRLEIFQEYNKAVRDAFEKYQEARKKLLEQPAGPIRKQALLDLNRDTEIELGQFAQLRGLKLGELDAIALKKLGEELSALEAHLQGTTDPERFRDEMAALASKGIGASGVAGLNRLVQDAYRRRVGVEEMEAKAKHRDDLTAEAKQWKEELKTPAQVLEEKIARVREAVGLEALSGAQADQLIAKWRQQALPETHLSTRGTFNGAALLGLQASGPQQRTAVATEKTAANTAAIVRAIANGLVKFF